MVSLKLEKSLFRPSVILLSLSALNLLCPGQARASDEESRDRGKGIAIVDPWNAVVVTGGKKGGSKAIIEGLEMPFDGRYWQQKIHEMKNPEKMQYFLPGETPQNWTEAVLIHKLQGQMAKSLTPAEIAQKVQRNPQISIISQSDTDLIYDGYTDNGTRYELVRVLKGNDMIYTLFYASKNPSTFATKRGEWLNLLKQAAISKKRA